MPSEKKKKSKLKKLKNADKVKVKAEPLDIKPLSSFIGDRVELIRQTFMCLKPKTVKQIAPDFLQGKSIDKIQEYCLDEVLGISKKRLTAIINNTKCPTDTESSDSDNSDIQKVDGHISLEEISSDSNDGGQKKLTKKTAKNAPKTATAANSKEKATEKNGNDGKNQKEMTVLELLELQARARAIRSQLAQEPVTKIELKSDTDDDADQQQQQPSSSSAATKRKAKDTSEPNPKSQKETEKPTTSTKVPPKPKAVKRVKLKRNFRKREVGDEDSEPDEPAEKQSDNEERQVDKEKEKTPPKEVEPEKTVPEKPTSDRSRDSSPEVIPMMPIPEVLCLSSESEGEAAEAFARRAKEREKSSIFRTDYLESLEQKSKEYIDSLKKKNSKEPVVAAVVVPVEKVVPAQPADEPEEGEIQDEVKSPEKKKPDDVLEAVVESNPEEVSNDTEKRRSDSSACLSVGLDNEELDYDKEESEKDGSEKSTSKDQTNVPSTSEEKSTNPDAPGSPSSGSESESENANSSSDSNENDDPKKNADQPDERPDTTSPTEKEQSTQDGEEDDFIDLDTIEIHDSSDDGTCERSTRSKARAGNKKVDSWNTRWLESSKVQKIIATSKLGNKVRGKLKKKKAKTISEHVSEANSADASPKVDASKIVDNEQKTVTEEQPEEPQHEVGSVQHYLEISAKDQEKVSAAEEA